ncbi:MAG: hypothetical protein L6Q29_03670 [Candidatus Pacebacteria bacterium]|nr:hypothetical protein [Candidatus Paceibacterota bacterium]NUQ57642.1 hypothetical protein [Candidatus Paceibacter sp.]
MKKLIRGIKREIKNFLFPADAMLERFQKKFPGKCPICSFRRYGIWKGFKVGQLPAHNCPENNTSYPVNKK